MSPDDYEVASKAVDWLWDEVGRLRADREELLDACRAAAEAGGPAAGALRAAVARVEGREARPVEKDSGAGLGRAFLDLTGLALLGLFFWAPVEGGLSWLLAAGALVLAFLAEAAARA